MEFEWIIQFLYKLLQFARILYVNFNVLIIWINRRNIEKIIYVRMQ